MCCTTAGSDIGSGRASSLTEAGPRLNRSTMTRRLGSASAWNTRSMLSPPVRRLSIYLTIVPRPDRGGPMSKLRCHISISLDGFVAGPNQSEENPLGEGGERLHDWVVPLAAWRQSHGKQGGEVNESTRVFEESAQNVGASVMGRNMFGPIGGGAWGDEQWTGWWGDDPPYHHSVFILTHHPRDPVEMEGGTTFHFVTDGIESALEQAREAAGGKDVRLWGGGNIVQQYLAAGLLDELELHVAPVLLGDGSRLFDNLGNAEVQLEQVRAVEAPGVTHLKYRSVK